MGLEADMGGLREGRNGPRWEAMGGDGTGPDFWRWDPLPMAIGYPGPIANGPHGRPQGGPRAPMGGDGIHGPHGRPTKLFPGLREARV